MSFQQFLLTHRDKLITLCSARIAEEGVEGLARDIAQCFADIAAWQHGHDSEPPSAVRLTSPPNMDAVIGSGPAMTRLRSELEQLGRRSRAPVAFVGEPGTGKRHCARELHRATYPDGDLFELDGRDCLAELEERVVALRSCVSAQAAVGMTVYVHDLSEQAPEVQARVSHLLRERSLQLRVVVSSTSELAQAARVGKLRRDLASAFTREVRIPSLSDRSDDIPELVRHFAVLAAWRAKSPPTEFDATALRRMQRHSWPQNVAELQAFVERISRELGGALVRDEDLHDLADQPSGVAFALPATGIDLAELERQFLTQALQLAHNNQTRAASLLGLTRDQIRYRMGKFEIVALARG